MTDMYDHTGALTAIREIERDMRHHVHHSDLVSALRALADTIERQAEERRVVRVRANVLRQLALECSDPYVTDRLDEILAAGGDDQ